ncbi:LLM class F420-dependent oxidoreductase [Streptacidiphilus sp. EB103A]|uniref:LLM class F420-dependent oxidoreductase n=1 Tax=Streptacidiphilus sp. EB103A TaxID=3156275 RepID=UPI00351952A0
MDIALHLPRFDLPGGPRSLPSVLAATARAADQTGFSALTLMDHWFQMEQPETTAHDPMLEGYTTLGYLAAQTQHLSLGLLVTGVTYRHPGLLAKTVTTLDVLSGGRALLGIGAAWYEREHHGLGIPFPPVTERFERLEETLQICRQMWSQDTGPYTGHHYQLAETICSPAPLQQPAPPIVIGGMGEKKTLRLVARYGDACNLFAFDPAEIARKLDALARHCDNQDRNPAEIKKTIIGHFDPLTDPDAFLTTMQAYARLGIQQVWVNPTGPDPAAWTARVGEHILPKLHEL